MNKKSHGFTEGTRLLLTVLVLVLMMAVKPVFADPVDTAGGASGDEMQQEAKKIDKLSKTSDGQAMVQKNLMERFGITEDRITQLRDQGMGYGEVGILYSLSQASGTDSDELLRMRTQEKMGWGEIAAKLNTSVGKAVNTMKGIGQSGDQTVTTEKPSESKMKGETDGQMGKPEKMDQSGMPEQAEKPERMERPEKPEHPEKPMKPERPGKF